ncbi:MAG: translation initiation factor IF-2 [Clostridiales bacterium]|nr:translation initiation factor IF-2 [Clostridiales bacterium]
MAKMKVHELAKELDKQSKEIIAFLQEKGIEVKAPQSSIEDSAIELIRKQFGKERAEATKQGTVEVEKDKAVADVPKKKKKIIFVSNPHNSKMPGQRPQQQSDERKSASAMGNNNSVNSNQRKAPEPYRPVKPLTPPSPTPPVTMVSTTNLPKREMKPTQETASAAEKQATAEKIDTGAMGTRMEHTKEPDKNRYQDNKNNGTSAQRSIDNNRTDNNRQYNSNRSDNNNNRPYKNRSDNNNNRPYNNNRPDSNRPYNNNRSNNNNRNESRSDNRNDIQRTTRPAYEGNQGDRNNYSSNTRPNRPYNNNESAGRSNAGADNKFRKPTSAKGFVPESPVKDTEKHRDEEKRRINQEKDKRSKKDLIYEDDSKVLNKNKAGKFVKPEKKIEETKEEQIKVITVPDSITIKELADKMKMQPSSIIKKLFLQGQIVTVNSELSFEEAENIAIDYEIICEKEVKVDVIEELLKEEEENEEELTARPPVICVMGHVDHGKTSLLDAIRKTNVTDKEAGGITQHIGAYTVNVNDQKITFLDTPGHEAFTAMRMRGANSTDIAILVVAADDGVMPQTVEAINHAKAAGIEIIVAVNKIDKPNANLDRVKQEMTEYELIPVDWGGTTEFVPVSAKSGEGIDTLLETILLTAEILELKANPARRARGLVIEAELDKGRGPVATVLVQKGTLHVGDFISAGASHGKVRAMIDDKGRRVKEALPSTPVEILGLSDVPSAGEVFIAHESDKTAKTYAETYLAQNKEKMLEDTKAKMSLDDLFTKIQAGNLKELNLIVKADVQGSVEAVKQSLLKLSNDEVIVKCIHGGVGAINESDVSLASASQAIIIGFNVRPDAMAKTISEREGVDIRLYKVIYQAIEDIEAAMKGMLDPVFEEKVIGHAEVRQIFKASAIGNIAGSYVLDGTFRRDCKVRVTRAGELVYEGELASLKRFKDDVKEVKAGFECGLVFDGFDQMQELDIVEAYIMVEVPR